MSMFVTVDRLLLPLAIAGALLSTACGDDDGGGSSAGLNNDADRTVYPEGPYGAQTDQVFPNLTFSQADGTPVDIASIRQDPANRVLFINTAAFWCGACIEEQPAIAALYNDFAGAGLEVLVTVFEKEDGTPADVADASRWQTAYSVPFPVVADPAGVLTGYYDPTLSPLNILIDLSSMEVIYRSQGADVDAIRQFVDALL
jgi:thiol-disulfide isomerase/thioredoxin